MSNVTTDFSSLPTEIRLQIWHFSCLTPRLIEIRSSDFYAPISLYPTRHATKVHDIQWVTKCPAPVALSVCRESREVALKVYTLRFEVLASDAYAIYINPLLDTIYGNFKWGDEFVRMLTRDMRAFDEEEIGIRNLALPLSYVLKRYTGFSGRDSLPLDTVHSFTVVIEESLEPHWQDWDEDCALVAPITDHELKTWEKECRKASAFFLAAVNRYESVPILNITAIRRGDAARALSTEDRKYPVLQGPRRPHRDHDVAPAGVAVWDRYDFS